MLKNIGWSGYNGTEIWKKMGSSANFLFGADLGAILSLIELDSFDESTETTLMVTEISYKMQTEEPEACSCTECSKAFQDLKRVAASFFVKRQ